MNNIKTIFCAVSLCALTACGGGGGGGNGGETKTSTPTSSTAPSSTPTTSTAASSSVATAAASLKLEAEDYINYSDTTSDNKGGASYRSGDGVDIESSTDTGAGYNIGYIDAGEWLEFGINVTKAGTFTADARVASAQDGGKFGYEIDGVAVGTTTNTSATGGWQVWTTLSSDIGTLSEGLHTFCVELKGGPFNLNWVTLKSADGGLLQKGTQTKGDKSVCDHPIAPPTITVPTAIRLNQLGFLPDAQKLAIVPGVEATTFSIVDTDKGTEVLNGSLSAAATWDLAYESVKKADFSSLTTAGNYKIVVAGVDDQPTFSISDSIYAAVNAASIKAFYYQRSGIELTETYAGIFKRPLGHPDTSVKVHISAATDLRPEGTIISGAKGWYDAGDYNKYVVNAGYTTYALLAAYEQFPDYFKAQNLNIPESGDAVPDLLNEIMWNLDWMLAMQDPNDGGVYFKLTSKSFTGFDMPDTDKSDRYVVKKSTTSTLDFAAVMAAASRIYAAYETEYPGVSAKMLAASKAAYAWAKANPKIYFSNPSDIFTGEYGDGDATDEFAWAAAELYVTTKDDAYYTDLNPSSVTADVPGWGNVKSFGWVSLAHHLNDLTTAADKDLIKTRLNDLAVNLVAKKQASAFAVSMEKGDFFWGSNGGAMGQAMMLLEAYKLDTTKTSYLDAAQSLFDYVLGRNPTDYSFITGYGKKSPMHIHHRISSADGVVAPIPGLLAGGPPTQAVSDCGASAYPFNAQVLAKSYLDNECSYSTNEIAINWNAPLVYVSAGLQVLSKKQMQ